MSAYPSSCPFLHYTTTGIKLIIFASLIDAPDPQALIQYPDVITAQAAKLSLDGQNIYNACCTLRWGRGVCCGGLWGWYAVVCCGMLHNAA